jgi:6-phosphogluconate dehydrogenase
MRAAFAQQPDLPNLLLNPHFAGIVTVSQQDLREVVAAAALHGVAVPAFMSALAYLDGYRSAVLPANLLQAQRDYFGAHTYRRTDQPGSFHTRWTD